MKITKKTRGVFKDIPNKQYHDDKIFLSSTTLKLALKSAQKFKAVCVDKTETITINENAMAIGNYCHTALLEPHLLDKETKIFKGTRRYGKDWEVFKDLYKDKTIITSSQADLVQTMLQSFDNSTVDSEEGAVLAPFLFEGGHKEESIFTEIDGVLVKVRGDYRKGDGRSGLILRDLKTTGATPNDIEEAREICKKYGYFISAALYVDAYETIFGVKPDFYLVFLSKKDFKVNVYRVGEETLETGRKKYKEGIRRIKLWRKTGNYESGVREL